jgi:hypothetical protein
MLILEPNGQLDRLPRRRDWRARLLAWLFGRRRLDSARAASGLYDDVVATTGGRI